MLDMIELMEVYGISPTEVWENYYYNYLSEDDRIELTEWFKEEYEDN